jgi:hypothetical protein
MVPLIPSLKGFAPYLRLRHCLTCSAAFWKIGIDFGRNVNHSAPLRHRYGPSSMLLNGQAACLMHQLKFEDAEKLLQGLFIDIRWFANVVPRCSFPHSLFSAIQKNAVHGIEDSFSLRAIDFYLKYSYHLKAEEGSVGRLLYRLRSGACMMLCMVNNTSPTSAASLISGP